MHVFLNEGEDDNDKNTLKKYPLTHICEQPFSSGHPSGQLQPFRAGPLIESCASFVPRG